MSEYKALKVDQIKKLEKKNKKDGQDEEKKQSRGNERTGINWAAHFWQLNVGCQSWNIKLT